MLSVLIVIDDFWRRSLEPASKQEQRKSPYQLTRRKLRKRARFALDKSWHLIAFLKINLFRFGGYVYHIQVTVRVLGMTK